MAEQNRPKTTSSAAHSEADHHGPEHIPSRDMLYEETFYSGRQTALLLSAMGVGFIALLVILFAIGFEN